MYCTHCGANNEEHAKFCVKCGKPMKAESASAKIQNSKKKKIFLAIPVLVFVSILAIVIYQRNNFDIIGAYNEFGLAKAMSGDKYGYVNEKNKVVVPIEFDLISDFTEDGLVVVQKNKKKGLYNINGEELIPVEYYTVGLYQKNKDTGLIPVSLDTEMTFFNSDFEQPFEEVQPCSILPYIVKKGEKYGCIDKEGNEIVPVLYDSISVREVQYDGYYRIDMGDECNFIDDLGNLKYVFVGNYSSLGLAVALNEEGGYGYVDTNGVEVIPFYYDEAEDFNEKGLAVVKEGDFYWIIDQWGVEVTERPYTYVEDFNDYGTALVKNATSCNFVPSSGEEQFEYIGEFMDGVAIAKRDGKYGLVNSNGILLTDTWYDKIYEDDDFIENKIIKARNGGKYVLLDWNGNEISSYYDGMDTSIVNERIICWDEKLYGLLDIEGQEIAEPQFVDIENMYLNIFGEIGENSEFYQVINQDETVGVLDGKEGKLIIHGDISYAVAYLNNDEPYIATKEDDGVKLYSSSGEVMLEGTFDQIATILSSGNNCLVRKGEKYAFMTLDGTAVTDFIYDRYGRFSDNSYYSYVNNEELEIVECLPVKEGDVWKILDYEGKEFLNLEFGDCPMILGDQIVGCNTDGEYGIWDLQGNEIVPCQYDNISRASHSYSLKEVEADGKCGVINETGELIVPVEYDEIIIRKNAIEVQAGDYCGILDLNGNTILSAQYDDIEIHMDPQTDVIVYYEVEKDGLYGIFDEYGTNIVPIECVYIVTYPEYDWLFRCEYEDETYAILDQYGDTVVGREQWISGIGSDGLITVNWYGDGYDVYDIKGYYRFSPDYDSVSIYDHGLAKVSRDGLYGFINTKGDLVIDCIYEDADLFGEDGLAPVMLGGKWGYIDENGHCVIDFLYDSADEMYNGCAEVSGSGEGTMGLIAVNGEEIVPLEYDSILRLTLSFSLWQGEKNLGVNEVGYVISEY